MFQGTGRLAPWSHRGSWVQSFLSWPDRRGEEIRTADSFLHTPLPLYFITERAYRHVEYIYPQEWLQNTAQPCAEEEREKRFWGTAYIHSPLNAAIT